MPNPSQHLKDNPSGFPYDHTLVHIQNGQPDTLLHWHPELEISYIHHGQARYHIHDDYFDSKAGDIILVQPSALHSIHPIGTQEQKSETFRIHLDNLGRSNVDKYSQRYLQPLHNTYFRLVPRIQPQMTGYPELKSCLFAIFQLVTEEPLYYDMMLKAKLHEYLYLLFKHRYVYRNYTDDTYTKYQKMRDLIDDINQRYAEQLTVSDLAKQFGYSRTHFMSVFKQQTGTTCLDYILQVRLEKACELLHQTTLPIPTIASETGFSNQANFNRQFKKRYQCTPLQYRKNSQQS